MASPLWGDSFHEKECHDTNATPDTRPPITPEGMSLPDSDSSSDGDGPAGVGRTNSLTALSPEWTGTNGHARRDLLEWEEASERVVRGRLLLCMTPSNSRVLRFSPRARRLAAAEPITFVHTISACVTGGDGRRRYHTSQLLCRLLTIEKSDAPPDQFQPMSPRSTAGPDCSRQLREDPGENGHRQTERSRKKIIDARAMT
ncbi:hypothetical protein FDECE_1922 [Fusarium decemcellulare]|nr:hypothetical protein FDECE_1922 [Fusarium decemcellulare]